MDEVGLQVADRLHHAFERGAHLGLELMVFGAALLDQPLGDGEPRLVAGQRDAELGALQVEIRSEAAINSLSPRS